VLFHTGKEEARVGKAAAMVQGVLMTALLASPVPARAAVVYVDPATMQWQSDQTVEDRDQVAARGSVWGEMEQAARIAAEQAGMAGRTATARTNDAVFAQAMAIHLNLPEGASVERLLNFRLPATEIGGPAAAAQPRQRTLIDLLLGSDVPEPGTWLYLILGFGLVGGMLRWRGPASRVQVTGG